MIATLPLTLALLGAAPAAPLTPSVPTCCASHPQQGGRRYEMTVEPLGGDCYRLHYAGSNVGVYMGWDGILLADTGFLNGAPEIELKLTELWESWWEENIPLLRAELEAARAEDDDSEVILPAKPEYLPVRYVVCTHFHPDHTEANAYFGLAGAQVIGHETVRRRLLGDTSIGDPKVLDPPMDPEGVPAITFADSLTIQFNGGPVEIRHLPLAHTDGDCTVHVPAAGVLFTGDVFNSHRFPYIELMVGARPSYLIAALEDMHASLPPGTRLMPGHGPAGDADTLREFTAMFRDCDRQMRREVAAGKNTMELYNQKLFGEYEDQWTSGLRGAVRGFVQILWFCYAPSSMRGLGELDRERPLVASAVYGCCAGAAALGARRFDAAALVKPFFFEGAGGPVMQRKD